jgi:MFS superfamily sulfate permease-like transporter
MKSTSLLSWSFLTVALLLLAAVWALPATASPATSLSTPTPTPLPTPDLNVTPTQVFNFWFMLIAGGVLLAILALSGHLLSVQILSRTVDRPARRDRAPKDR